MDEHKVVKGWEVAFLTMAVGESATLRIAPAYGYGEAGSPGATKAETIPPNATIEFEVRHGLPTLVQQQQQHTQYR